MSELWMGLTMLIGEVMDVGTNTLSKAAMAKGMSNLVFITYTRAISFLYLIPFAFILHRKIVLPRITLSIIWRLILLGVLRVSAYAFLFFGIRCSSPTLASTMTNLSPAFTFVLAIIFRMEVLNLRSRSSQLKIIGTIISITGALIVTFYKGLPITIFPAGGSSLLLHDTQPNWIMGGLFLATSSIFLSLTYIVKTSLSRIFPLEVLITLIGFFVEAMIAAPVTLIVEKDTNAWFPTLDIQLIAIVFGALENGFISTLHTWACAKKGPVYVVMFKPLQIIIAAILATSFLKEVLHLGSVIGGLTIAIGFYTVMQGKVEEGLLNEVNSNDVLKSSSNSCVDYMAPLLGSKEDV